jgi:hypothetical protein
VPKARAATREHLRRTFEAVITFIADPEETERIHAEVNAPVASPDAAASARADDLSVPDGQRRGGYPRTLPGDVSPRGHPADA